MVGFRISHGKEMKALVIFIVCGCMELLSLLPSFAQPMDSGGTAGQTQARIILVDDLGIYVPGRVFYWDESLGRAKIKKLQQLARSLMNKEVLLTYSAKGDLASDRRPLVLDLEDFKGAPAKAQPPDQLEEGQSGSDAASREGLAVPAQALASVKPSSEPDQPGSDRRGEQDTAGSDDAPAVAHPLPGGAPSSDSAGQGDRTGSTGPDAYDEKYTHYSSTETAAFASLSRAEIIRFIKNLLTLNNNKAIGPIMDHYADEVEYYTRGLVNKDYVRRDLGYYFRNWESINTALDGDVVIIVTDEKDLRVVKFLTTFDVRNAQKSVRGTTENIWKIKKINNQLRLVGVKQHVVGSETLPP